MKNLLQKLLNTDRRILFALTAFVIMLPIIKPLGLPGVEVTDAVKGVYNTVESLPPGSAVLVSFDYDPSSKPELYPMSVAFCRHVFARNLRLVAMTLWAPGTGLTEEAIRQTAAEYGKKDGVDYVFLGFQPQHTAVITQLGEDIFGMFPRDHYGVATRPMPVLAGIRTLKDFSFMMDFSAGFPGLDEWIIYGSDKFGLKIGCGATAVSEPAFRPYLNSGQLVGVIGALKGAAEYEQLINRPDKASAGMEAVSLGHFLMLALIFGANLIIVLLRYFL